MVDNCLAQFCENFGYNPPTDTNCDNVFATGLNVATKTKKTTKRATNTKDCEKFDKLAQTQYTHKVDNRHLTVAMPPKHCHNATSAHHENEPTKTAI